MGIGIETFQTDTDPWRLNHTNTDILVCYNFFQILHRYYLNKSVLYRFTNTYIPHTDTIP